MAKNLKALGEVFDYPATRTIKSGDVVVMTDTVGVALVDGVNGDTIAVRVEGVFEVPKAADAVIEQGQVVYWDGTAIAGEEGEGNTYAGRAYVASAAADTTVQVKLNA